MFGLAVTIDDTTKRVKAAADRATFKNLGHAAATIRKQSAASIEVSGSPSEPGTPPHTRKRLLKGSIRYAVDREQQEAVIGAEYSKVGESASAHELGGEFKGAEYEERPFMFPSLEANLDRFAAEYTGSIGE